MHHNSQLTSKAQTLRKRKNENCGMNICAVILIGFVDK